MDRSTGSSWTWRAIGASAIALALIASHAERAGAQVLARSDPVASRLLAGPSPTPAPNRANDRRSLSAVRATERIRVDGVINEAAWSVAPAGTDFVQRVPDALQPATQRTEVRILVDDAALYVAMRMFDSAADSIMAPLGRRNAELYSDWAHVLIDGYHDRRTAFRFMVKEDRILRASMQVQVQSTEVPAYFTGSPHDAHRNSRPISSPHTSRHSANLDCT